VCSPECGNVAKAPRRKRHLHYLFYNRLGVVVAKARIVFEKLIQDSQNYGSNDEHMVSRVFFTLEITGQKLLSLTADIKQSVGANYEASALEVSRPRDYSGPLDYESFRHAVEEYYRSLVGRSGSGVHISGGHVRMRDNILVHKSVAEFEVGAGSAGW
jgi:hypothetical protein